MSLSWRESVVRNWGPGICCGMPLRVWLRALRENDFDVDASCWRRCLTISLATLPNSLFAVLERLAYGRRIRKCVVEPPVFIVGAWRSGTTLLHNLFAQDERFAFPNNYEVFYPHTFL